MRTPALLSVLVIFPSLTLDFKFLLKNSDLSAILITFFSAVRMFSGSLFWFLILKDPGPAILVLVNRGFYLMITKLSLPSLRATSRKVLSFDIHGTHNPFLGVFTPPHTSLRTLCFRSFPLPARFFSTEHQATASGDFPNPKAHLSFI